MFSGIAFALGDPPLDDAAAGGMNDAPATTEFASTEAAAARPTVKLRNLRKHRQKTLRGFCTVEHASGLVLHEVALHHDGDQAWASPPVRPMIDADGRVRIDEHGRRRWQEIVGFRKGKRHHAWTAQVIGALNRTWPDLFTVTMTAVRRELHRTPASDPLHHRPVAQVRRSAHQTHAA